MPIFLFVSYFPVFRSKCCKTLAKAEEIGSIDMIMVGVSVKRSFQKGSSIVVRGNFLKI